jgi:sugar phosphate isomerase/epimerase
MTKGAGADIVIVAETSNAIHGDRSTPLSERPRLHKDDWRPYGAKMTEFAERLADEGLKLCYHHHMGTIIQSERDIDALMAHTCPPVHLLLDTGHARWGGADPAGLARAYRSRIGHVHCKDVRESKMRSSNAGDLSYLDSNLGHGNEVGVYPAPGAGALDYVSVFEELKGYSGWVVLEAEQDPKKAPALPYAKKGVAHVRAALKEAGLA